MAFDDAVTTELDLTANNVLPDTAYDAIQHLERLRDDPAGECTLTTQAKPVSCPLLLKEPGYYIARVNARSPAHGAATVDNPRTRELIKQDYVTQRFMSWANEVLAKAAIE